jgi:hypothetical protein
VGVDPESADVAAPGGAHGAPRRFYCPAGRRAWLEQPPVCSANKSSLSLDRRAGLRALDRSPGRRPRAVPFPGQANLAFLSAAKPAREREISFVSLPELAAFDDLLRLLGVKSTLAGVSGVLHPAWAVRFLKCWDDPSPAVAPSSTGRTVGRQPRE